MAVDETLKRPGYAKRSLLDLVAGAGQPAASVPPPASEPEEPESSPPKKSDPLPRRGEPYRPYARFMNRLGSDQHFIHFVHGDFIRDGFSYSDLRRVILLDGEAPGKGSTLVLKFVEAVVTVVTIEGRNLDDLHYYIHEKAVPWLWERPKGFQGSGDQATVITRIGIEELER